MVLVVEVGFRLQVRRSCFRSGCACLCRVWALAESVVRGVDVAWSSWSTFGVGWVSWGWRGFACVGTGVAGAVSTLWCLCPLLRSMRSPPSYRGSRIEAMDFSRAWN